LQKNISFEQRDFFKRPFSRAEIIKLLQGRPAIEMFNPRSPAVRNLEQEPELYTDDELIDLMAGEPRFIRRPVVNIDGKVYFSADVKKLQELLG